MRDIVEQCIPIELQITSISANRKKNEDFLKIRNTLQIYMLSSCSSHANLLCILPILVYMLLCLKKYSYFILCEWMLCMHLS